MKGVERKQAIRFVMTSRLGRPRGIKCKELPLDVANDSSYQDIRAARQNQKRSRKRSNTKQANIGQEESLNTMNLLLFVSRFVQRERAYDNFLYNWSKMENYKRGMAII